MARKKYPTKSVNGPTVQDGFDEYAGRCAYTVDEEEEGGIERKGLERGRPSCSNSHEGATTS